MAAPSRRRSPALVVALAAGLIAGSAEAFAPRFVQACNDRAPGALLRAAPGAANMRAPARASPPGMRAQPLRT
jgi:hypothetical protein